jgi:hypothetical protein
MSSELARLDALVGNWTIEATHPSVPGTVVHGESRFEWLEGGRFLIQRSRNEHPDFPDSIAIIGVVDDALSMHYYDSRGVHRIYDVAVDESTWRLARDAPGFSQRLAATIEGDTIAGTWQLSRDGSTWDDDLAITFRRRR